MPITERTPVSVGGQLFVVATPIGNLEDLTERARQVLAKADLVAAEDTRHSGRLLQHLGLNKQMLALHDHNERARVNQVLEALSQGQSVALVSDAGTPLISDPGYILVREARAAGFQVSPIPGACALVAALSAAGLPTDQFLFAGFLPAKRAGRKSSLENFKRQPATLVFYESPHRITDLMEDLVEVLGAERECVLGRELTKTFETFYSGPAAQVLTDLQADPHGSKGEFVVMVRGSDEAPGAEASVDADKLLAMLVKELPVKKAARIVADVCGLGKNELYQRALALKEG
ncbi:16S rRNA (cytidine(1402)-2'-O)-methyltransferase [Marinobacter litoralis]|uniref:16S rRNA (cytidine(1402)-2'-O)-methyltransferase n=1 Tax=Marinobacter litoralis TaxID=187981 RepID=UPI0018EBCC2A|nr:16S rRNA (cytidine(1402)-2'-O)-methyltransferase [Marinobacter litoralis]MBJ6138434.1 16S rRNA (cytidine(1402)-2'-O)-methyltransferase [Marinobacter litoralis]